MNTQAREGIAAGMALVAIAIKREKEAKARALLAFARNPRNVGSR